MEQIAEGISWDTLLANYPELDETYRLKEQLTEDVESIRAEVRRKGGIGSKDIEKAIKKYRKNTAKLMHEILQVVIDLKILQKMKKSRVLQPAPDV